MEQNSKWRWRPYQVDCINAIYNKYKQGVKRQLLVLPTGVGKRAMACEIARHFERTLFIAHREELIEQAFYELETLFPLQCGIIKAERFEIDKKIVVASAQTLYRRLDKINPQQFDLLIVDEAHHFVSRTFILPLRHFTPKLLTGWSATPTRLDNLELSDIFDEITFEYKLEEAINNRFLCNLNGIIAQTTLDLSSVKKVAGDFNQKELSNIVDCELRNQLIVGKYKQYALKKQAVAFCVDIEHANNVAEAFNGHKIPAASIHSELSMEERKRLITAYKNKEIKVLSNVGILTEGWDYHDVECVLMARPTQSLAVYLQAIGRGTRLKSVDAITSSMSEDELKVYWDYKSQVEDKSRLYKYKNGVKFFKEYDEEKWTEEELKVLDYIWPYCECKIIDFVDNCGKHNLINTWTLDKNKKGSHKVFQSFENRKKLENAEKERRIARISHLQNKDEKVNLLSLPKVTYSNGEWRKDAATDKQIAWLKTEGVWQKGVEYTKLQATQYISNFQCKDWQLDWLDKMGYNTENGATVGEYQLARKHYVDSKETSMAKVY